MPPRWPFALIAALAAALTLRGDAIPAPHPIPTLTSPRLILWAWEEPEDLRPLDPAQAGVAFLAERIFLGTTLRSIPRHQRILVAPGTWAEAVVRIETTPNFTPTDALRDATVQQLLRTAALPGIRSLQVDFDATQSQRAFYADLLRRTRASLPPHIGLSITALVSWCSVSGGFLHTLPIDHAVPMYFRLGEHIGYWPIREPLCTASIGLSTDEPQTAPATIAAAHTYLFAPHPWTSQQLLDLNHHESSLVPKGGY